MASEPPVTTNDEQINHGRAAMGAETAGTSDRSSDQEYRSGTNEAPDRKEYLLILEKFGPGCCNAVDGDSDRTCMLRPGHGGEHHGHGPIRRWDAESARPLRAVSEGEVVVDRLASSAQPTPDARGWQPMETAPKDGTPILAIEQYGFYCVVRFENGIWAPWGPALFQVEPIHWMPLPAAPAPEERTR